MTTWLDTVCSNIVKIFPRFQGYPSCSFDVLLWPMKWSGNGDANSKQKFSEPSCGFTVPSTSRDRLLFQHGHQDKRMWFRILVNLQLVCNKSKKETFVVGRHQDFWIVCNSSISSKSGLLQLGLWYFLTPYSTMWIIYTFSYIII